MSITSTTPTAPERAVPPGAVPVSGLDRLLTGPAGILAVCLLGCAAFFADAASGQADLGLVGVVLMTVALASTLVQAVRARIGRPWRRSRRAAAVGTAASLFVAAFLSSVGVLERMGPQVTGSAAFGAGVAMMSVTLLIVLPLALVVFAWGVSQDRRLAGWVRALPWAVMLVVALTAVTVAVARGSQELWSQAVAAVVASALLTGFSAGVSTSRDRHPGARPDSGR